MKQSAWIGWDPREADAYAVARASARRHMTLPLQTRGVVLSELQRAGLYRRPIEMRASAADRPIMWDTISDAPMSTQHACARFLVPHLARTGWAVFMDGDVLVRGNICRMFDKLDRRKAVYCVKHRFDPPVGVKMDGQQQTRYARKNWSSVVAFNCDHEANRALTLDLINSVPGRDLHAFCWLEDSLIGELSPEWNFLVGHTDPSVEPKIVHFTDGTPSMPGYEHVPFADEWRAELEHWAA